ncbi:ATP-binding cassette domain-containing protein [Ruminococcaceae bacterium OttesenSCG-928-I18]|nr:ATP-binding cassette domain-containing protein [Ruminococcaceae bacterium OttesenSCG-928-I18]
MRDIVLNEVTKAYGEQTVLREFTARFKAGEVSALLGPSGAGKTTIARLVLGLERPDAGTISGADVRCSCVFQEDRLCPGLTAEANVQLVLPHAQWPRVAEALRELGFTKEDAQKQAQYLSGGQKRRVALVRAVEAQGELLVLDEAFKGLDEENREKAVEYVKRGRGGRTLLLITHDPREAETFGAKSMYVPPGEKVWGGGEETRGEVDNNSERSSS